jgi:hypothetical protein
MRHKRGTYKPILATILCDICGTLVMDTPCFLGRTCGSRKCRSLVISRSKGRKNLEIGSKFGKWTVTGAGVPRRRGSTAICRCVCGAEAVVPVSNLKRGGSKGCRRCSQRRVNIHGVMLSFAEIAEICNLNFSTIYWRFRQGRPLMALYRKRRSA